MKKTKLFAATLLTAAFSAGLAMTSFAGWSQNGGNWNYYNDKSGELVRDDWVQDGGRWYYVDNNGVMQTNRLVDEAYYVDGNGWMVTNAWVLVSDGGDAAWRYFGSNGKAAANGWKEIDGSSYHFTDYEMDTDWFEENGKTYYLGSSGVMRTGWHRLTDADDEWGENWYYFGSNGRRVSGGEQTISGETYLFDETGRMLSGWVNMTNYSSSENDDLSGSDIDSLKYYKNGGQRASGWQYLSSPDGAEENWYYFKDGRAYSANYKTTAVGNYGMVKISGDTYCFDREGRMQTGLIEIADGRKFFFDESGKMKTGRVVVNDENHDNEVFYFTTSGTLGSKGDGFTGVKDGSLYDEGILIRAEDGMRYEKVEVDGKSYVVNEQGKVKTGGTVTDADGVKYKIEKNSDGSYKITVEN